MNLITVLMVAFAIAVAAAVGYERGRRAMKRDVLKYWERFYCKDCGAGVQPWLLHASGCDAGWPSVPLTQPFPLDPL
jgi:hypothetical protein